MLLQIYIEIRIKKNDEKNLVKLLFNKILIH